MLDYCIEFTLKKHCKIQFVTLLCEEHKPHVFFIFKQLKNNILREALMRFKILKLGNLIFAFFILSGCVSTASSPIFSGSKPIIDKKGVDLNAYEADLKDCTEYANEISVGQSILTGSAVGAAIGGVVEVLSDEEDAIELGAVSGGAKSGILSVREKERVVKKCLRGRGYKVLN